MDSGANDRLQAGVIARSGRFGRLQEECMSVIDSAGLGNIAEAELRAREEQQRIAREKHERAEAGFRRAIEKGRAAWAAFLESLRTAKFPGVCPSSDQPSQRRDGDLSTTTFGVPPVYAKAVRQLDSASEASKILNQGTEFVNTDWRTEITLRPRKQIQKADTQEDIWQLPKLKRRQSNTAARLKDKSKCRSAP